MPGTPRGQLELPHRRHGRGAPPCRRTPSLSPFTSPHARLLRYNLPRSKAAALRAGRGRRGWQCTHAPRHLHVPAVCGTRQPPPPLPLPPPLPQRLPPCSSAASLAATAAAPQALGQQGSGPWSVPGQEAGGASTRNPTPRSTRAPAHSSTPAAVATLEQTTKIPFRG